MTDHARAGPEVAGARVPPLERREDLSAAQQAVWDHIAASRSGVAGPFKILLHSPEVARRIADVGAWVRFEGVLAQADRELAILAVARALDCRYEWAAHAPLARRAGVRAEAIDAIRERRAPAGLMPAEAQVVGYATALLGEHRVAADAFAALRARFGVEGLVDLTATIGYYAMLACALNAFDVVPSPDAGGLPP